MTWGSKITQLYLEFLKEEIIFTVEKKKSLALLKETSNLGNFFLLIFTWSTSAHQYKKSDFNSDSYSSATL